MIGSRSEMNAALAAFDTEIPEGSRSCIDYVGDLNCLVGLAISRGLCVTMRRFEGIDRFEVRCPTDQMYGVAYVKGEFEPMHRCQTVLTALKSL